MAIDNTGITSLDTGAGEITYSGNEGPKSPDQELMAQADPMVIEMYEQYVFEMEEQGIQPMPFRDFMQQIIAESRIESADGGIARIGLWNGGNPHRGGYKSSSSKSVGAPKDSPASEPPRHHAVDTGNEPEAYIMFQGQQVPQSVWGTTADPRETTDVLPKENFFKNQLNARSKLAYNLVPNKFSWTYDKRKAFFNQLSPAQKKALGYGKHFEKDWDELEEWEKNMLMDYDVYSDFNELGYQNFLDENYRNTNEGGDDDRPIYPLQASVPGTDTPVDEVDPVTGFPTDAIRFAGGISPVHDFTGIYGQREIPMAADGGRIGYAGGGITDLRQGYFLGKLVKKAGRALKKVAKSPIGRMGLMALGGWGLNQFAPKALGGGWVSGLKEMAQKKEWLGNLLLNKKGGFNPWKLGILGMSAYPLVAGMGKEEDEDFTDTDLYKSWLARKQGWDTQFAPVGDEANFQRMRLYSADGGRIGYAKGGNDDEEDHRSAALSAMYRPGAQEGGLMDMGGMEKDYRNEGGFVPIGGQERADDVPARLSKNEFVFTADAVRNAGGGDIDKGAEIMENLMENLEQGGKVSEESQGLEGARNMFATSQRLEGVL